MLIDRFARVHDYLRIAVTDRCNFRCAYCMPEEGIPLGPRTELLTFEEIARLAALFVHLGVRKVRITGGEPLVRHGIENLFPMLSGISGLEELALSTNGALLEEKLPMLWKHGVRQLNISLDTLRRDRFQAITGRDESETVQRAIRAAVAYRSHGGSFQSVKINMVVMRGMNDDELLDFVRFGEALRMIADDGPSIEIRFIEFMPFRGNAWEKERCVTLKEMKDRIESAYKLNETHPKEPASPAMRVRGPAKSFEVIRSSTIGANFRIGFITTVSEPFCSDCGRLRLTADGTLRTCLFGQRMTDHADGLNLRDMLRNGATDDTMASAITDALQEKWLEHPPVQELAYLNTREMISIGG